MAEGKKSLLRRWVPRLNSGLNLGSDLLAITLAMVVATVINHGRFTWAGFSIWAIAAGVWAVGTFVVRYYDPWAHRSWLEEMSLISLVVALIAVTLGLYKGLILHPQGGLPRIGHFFLTVWPVLVGSRLFLFRRLEAKEPPLDDVLVIGTGGLARATADELEQRSRVRLRVLGHLRLRSEAAAESIAGRPVLGTTDDLEKCLRTMPVSEVYVAVNTARAPEDTQAAVKVCERFGVPFALPAYTVRLERSRPTNPGAVNDGYLHYVTHDSRPYQRAVKRLFDIVAATTALFLLTPLFLVVAALIKLTSKGPLFFKQQRVGLHGRPFHMLKFRTMIPNADAMKERLAAQNEQTGPVFKIKNDPRVTPIGRFLRKHSIDELPQLINVLRGDMSVVGPRPPVPKEVAQYEAWQRRRLSVRPGLTCIWQVSGRNQISFEEWMYLDMRYIDHWSFREDLSLILRTFPVVLTGRGAS